MVRPIPLGLTATLVLLAASLAPAGEESAPAVSAETSAIQALVDGLRPMVAEIRGLPWKRGVEAKVLTRDELRAFLKESMDREVTPEELERDNRIVRRVGMMKADEDLVSMQMLMLQEMIAGAYDPQTKKLYLIEGFDGEAQKPTLVHELIHALDDQYFDLEAMEKPFREDDPDRQFAIRCLFEGSAEYGRRVFQDRDPAAARSYYEQSAANKDAMAGQMRVMNKVPTHMLLATLLHYRMGPNFVTEAIGRDFAGGMQRLFDDPPTTQEHILHPWKWLGPARDYPRTVTWGGDFAAAAGAGWTKLVESSVGELDLAVYLDYFLGDKDGRLNTETMGLGEFVSPLASRAAAGWDAGREQYLEGPGKEIIVISAYAFDSHDDAAEAANFIGAALRKANGETWKGLGWTFADDSAQRTFDYYGEHGRGRILQRGREVLVLDGVSEDCLEALWTVVARTSFVQDERDRGDSLPNPFDGCAVVDRRRGLGLRLPAGWTAETSDRTPASFADASNGQGTQVSFLVIDQEVTEAGLPRIGRMVLGGMFNPAVAKPARVMRGAGLVHPMPAPPGRQGRLYLGSDAARTYVVVVTGTPEGLAAADADVQRMLDGVPTPRTTPSVSPGTPEPVGLRSIPGY